MPPASFTAVTDVLPVERQAPLFMSTYALLNKVTDRESFITFVRALADERERAAIIEREDPESCVVDGAHDWKNADIPSFLYATLDYFEDKPFHKPEEHPSWRMFAEFLWCGKIIE